VGVIIRENTGVRSGKFSFSFRISPQRPQNQIFQTCPPIQSIVDYAGRVLVWCVIDPLTFDRCELNPPKGLKDKNRHGFHGAAGCRNQYVRTGLQTRPTGMSRNPDGSGEPSSQNISCSKTRN
jgi:hypothetical protein